MKIIFIGTSEFGTIILKNLIKADFKPILVISPPDKPKGRKQILTSPPVKIVAQNYNIPVAQPEKVSSIKNQLASIKPDLIIIAEYGQIIPQDILNIPKYGCLNVHPSLLPKYRGPSPIQYTILNGDKKTGVTIILVDEEMDHGPILAQRELELSSVNYQSSITYPELNKKLADLGADLLIETIPGWINNEIKAVPQEHSKASYTKILKKEDGKIDWSKTAEEIERKIRAFNPWPGSFTTAEIKNKPKTIKILKADILKQTEVGPFGKVGKVFLAPDDKIAVQTKKDYLIIEKLQLEGKKETTVKEFLNGHPDFIGTILR